MSSENNDKTNGFSNSLKHLETLVDEALQVYELDSEKTNIIDELYNSLRVITNFLGYAVDLPADVLNLSSDRRVILTAALDVIIIKPNGKSEQKKLDEFPFEDILRILEFGIPKLLNLIRTERTDINDKVMFLRSAGKKLMQIHNINNHEKPENLKVQLEGVRS